jgi:hypothetical protein
MMYCLLANGPCKKCEKLDDILCFCLCTNNISLVDHVAGY